MAKKLEFFFDCLSPYSYLASTQLEAIARRTAARIEWRPFLLGAVFKASGNTSPAMVPAKLPYLAKDVERWLRHYGQPALRWPEDWPINSLLANRLALVAGEQGKLEPYVHRVFRALFAEGRDISSVEVLSAILGEVGLDPRACLARAEDQEIKDRLRKNTDEAVERGAFGAPTFFIGEEMYVGNDRLPFVEQALYEGRAAPGKYRLDRDDTALLVIDIQERLCAAMEPSALARVVRRSCAAIEGARALGLPIVVTEQYPKGLGRTVPEVREALGALEPLEKVDFSCVRDEVLARLQGRRHVLLVGMEAHVCVYQTARDLAERGLTPYLLRDGVLSRTAEDREVGIALCQEVGAVVSTVESALFDMLGHAGTPEFKRISAAVK